MKIHPSAIVDVTAKIGHGVQIGPYAVIEPHVEIGDESVIGPRAVVRAGTKLGCGNTLDIGVVLGGRPQHLAVGADQSVGQLIIGDRNQFRENSTVHLAWKPGDSTRLGNDNYVMIGAHIGHDCAVGDKNVIANNVMLAGHVEVGDRVYLSGAAGIHQFCRVGSYAMVGGQARVTQDIPPYVMVDGVTTCLVGLNSVGLRRAGMHREQIQTLKAAYRLAFRSELGFEDRLVALQQEFPTAPANEFWKFLSTGNRGFLKDRRGPSTRSRPLRVVFPPDEQDLREAA